MKCNIVNDMTTNISCSYSRSYVMGKNVFFCSFFFVVLFMLPISMSESARCAMCTLYSTKYGRRRERKSFLFFCFFYVLFLLHGSQMASKHIFFKSMCGIREILVITHLNVQRMPNMIARCFFYASSMSSGDPNECEGWNDISNSNVLFSIEAHFVLLHSTFGAFLFHFCFLFMLKMELIFVVNVVANDAQTMRCSPPSV